MEWDLSKSCGMGVYRAEKLNVWIEIALWTPKRANDDSKFVELSLFILFEKSNFVYCVANTEQI